MEVFQLNAPNPDDLPASKRNKKEKDDQPEPDVRVSAGGVAIGNVAHLCG